LRSPLAPLALTRVVLRRCREKNRALATQTLKFYLSGATAAALEALLQSPSRETLHGLLEEVGAAMRNRERGATGDAEETLEETD
jgi:hypothetical protein